MNKSEFETRMDSAYDKEKLISLASAHCRVLDLGAGSGYISRRVAEAGVIVDSVDLRYKDIETPCNDKLTYYAMSINEFLDYHIAWKKEKYDAIILSAILHELSLEDLEYMRVNLPKVMAEHCSIYIREPFGKYTQNPRNTLSYCPVSPIKERDADEFVKLAQEYSDKEKLEEWLTAYKLSGQKGNISDEVNLDADNLTAEDWLNYIFTVSYGEDSWEREKHEYRFAKSLAWCQEYFNFNDKPYRSFSYELIKNNNYAKHFQDAGFPSRLFELVDYTTTLVTIKYGKGIEDIRVLELNVDEADLEKFKKYFKQVSKLPIYTTDKDTFYISACKATEN